MSSRIGGLVTAGLLALALTLTVVAQDTEPPPVLPAGGDELLVRVLESCLDCDDLTKLLTVERSPDEWEAYFRERQQTGEGARGEGGTLAGLTGAEVDTLTAYLSLHLPLADGSTAADFTVDRLPAGGRELLETSCNSCHSLTVSVRPDWESQDEWIELLEDGRHRRIGLTEQETAELANYLAINRILVGQLE